MPIKGLTNTAGAFPRIGILRKGAPKPENGIGADLDRFRFDSDPHDAGLEAEFTAAFGKEPRRVTVMFPYRSKAENWSAWLEEYSSGGFKRRCDGETQHAWRDLNTGRISHKCIACIANAANKDDRCQCRRVGRLTLVIPALKRLAYVTSETHSINDIVNIDNWLTNYEAAFGGLAGIPFFLSRVPTEISTPDPKSKSGRARRTKHLLRIEPDPEWVEKWLQRQGREAQALISGTALAQLPMASEPEPDDFDQPDTVLATDADGVIENESSRMSVSTAIPPATPPAAAHAEAGATTATTAAADPVESNNALWQVANANYDAYRVVAGELRCGIPKPAMLDGSEDVDDLERKLKRLWVWVEEFKAKKAKANTTK